MWKLLSCKAYNGDDPDIIAFAEIEYTPGDLDAPLVQTRGVKDPKTGQWKNYPVCTLKVHACKFHGACVKRGKEDRPYIQLIGWETPREGLADIALDCVRMLAENAANRNARSYGARADDLAKQAEDAVAGGRKRGGK